MMQRAIVIRDCHYCKLVWERIAFLTAWGLIGLLAVSIPIALHFLPMRNPLLFAVFTTTTLLSLVLALVQFQRQRSTHTYEEFVRLERLSMLAGIIGLFGTAPRI